MLCLLAAMVLALPGAAPPPEWVTVDFAVSEYKVPGRISEILTPDLNGDGHRDLCILSIERDGNDAAHRFVSVVRARPEPGFPPALDQTLEVSQAVIALCLGDFTPDPGTEIGALMADGLRVYAQDAAGNFVEQKAVLLPCPSFYEYAEEGDLPVWHDRLDLNGDGRDDCYLPQRDGYAVFLQTEPGKFAPPRHCAVAATSRIEDAAMGNNAEITFVSHVRSLPRLEAHDFDGDGRKDLLALETESLAVFLQDAGGGFPEQPSFRHPLDFLKDLVRRDTVDVAILQFADLNGDRRLDLLVTRIHGEIGVFESMQTDLYAFFGHGAQPFAPAPDQTLRINGVSIPPQFVDVNADGRQDLVCSALRTDLWKNLGTALLRRFEITYYLYQFGAGRKPDRYPEHPSFDWTVSVSTEAMEKGGTNLPRCYFGGDFDGDKRLDLAQITGEGRLAIRRGRVGVAGIFRSSTIDYTKDEIFTGDVGSVKGVDLLDLDGNGCCDGVFRYNDSVRVYLSKGPETHK